MSVISDRHTIVPLTKDSKPMDGQRLVRLIAKGENKNPNLSQSMCVSVPRVSSEVVADAIDRLLPHVVGMVQDAQDKIIRELRIADGVDAVSDADIGIEKVIEWLDANAAGDRVSSEYLQAWFMDEYKDVAMEYIAHAMDASKTADGEYPKIVHDKCNVLRDMFAGWASPKYSPAIPKLRAMIKFVECLAPSDLDGRMSAILTRCTVMLTKKESELSEDALGF